MIKQILLFTCLFTLILPVSRTAYGKLLFVGDFEHGPIPLTSDNPDSIFSQNAYSVSVVNSPVAARAGVYYLKSYTQLEGNHFRSEIYPKNCKFAIGKGYWTGISIFIPNDWVDETVSLDSPLVFQWHHNSWSGLPEMNLPLNLSLTEANNWVVKVATNQGVNFKKIYEKSYLADKGKWTDWVFNFRFSPNEDGFVKVWKNGESVANHTGSNYAAGHEDYFANIQFGLYSWGYRDTYNESLHKTTSRTIYHDELRIGDSTSSYDEVSPVSQTQSPASPENLSVK